MLEQPADPRKYMRGCPTFRGTTQWEAFEEMEGMAEYEFYQGDFAGAAQKPTTLGTNLHIDLPERSSVPVVAPQAPDILGHRQGRTLPSGGSWAP